MPRRVLDKIGGPDRILFGLISVLVVWGIFAVGTVSFPFSLQRYGHPWHYFFHQLLMLGIGVGLAIFFFKLPTAQLKRWAPFLFLGNLILVMAVFLPKIGVTIGGAQRWLNFGKFLLQPSEFLKLSFMLYLAAWLSGRFETQRKATASHPKLKLSARKLTGCFAKRQRAAIQKRKGIKSIIQLSYQLLVPFFIMVAILLVVLILQPDMSTLGIICVAGLFMYFMAGTPWWHALLITGVGTGAAMLLIKIKPYRLARLLVFLKPETDPYGIGYQLRQALIAIGSGRIFGIENGFSFGLSRQKFGFLPHPMTDSIFAIIGEELGFLGAVLLILLLVLLLWRGLKIAALAENTFEKLLVSGIVVWFVSQAFFNIGGIIGILPLAGIPLPFFSYGGSHLIAEMAAVGILLNISKNN